MRNGVMLPPPFGMIYNALCGSSLILGFTLGVLLFPALGP